MRSAQHNVAARYEMFKHDVTGRALPDQLIGCCDML
jgi:hypothetical protein